MPFLEDFVCVGKITIARILRLTWIQICIYFYANDISAPVNLYQGHLIDVFLENVSSKNQGVSVIAEAVFKYLLFWVSTIG